MINPNAIDLWERYQSATGEDAEWYFRQYVAAVEPSDHAPAPFFDRDPIPPTDTSARRCLHGRKAPLCAVGHVG